MIAEDRPVRVRAMITLAAPETHIGMPEARCPRCHRLLFKGRLIGEILCTRCDLVVKYKIA